MNRIQLRERERERERERINFQTVTYVCIYARVTYAR